MSNRKFYKYVFQFEVLSENPLGDVSLEQLNYLTDEGDCSGRFLEKTEKVINAKETADLLIDQGSDPQFFFIDEDGNDIEI